MRRTTVAAFATAMVSTGPRIAITPTATMFEDKSFVGDTGFVTSVFESRAAQLAAWRHVLRALEKAHGGAGISAAALERAVAQIDSTPHDDAGNQVRALEAEETRRPRRRRDWHRGAPR